jgi:hypothetical protein
VLYSGRFWPFRQTSDQDGKACKGSDKHSSVLQNLQITEEKSFTTLCLDATQCFYQGTSTEPSQTKCCLVCPLQVFTVKFNISEPTIVEHIYYTFVNYWRKKFV